MKERMGVEGRVGDSFVLQAASGHRVVTKVDLSKIHLVYLEKAQNHINVLGYFSFVGQGS